MITCGMLLLATLVGLAGGVAVADKLGRALRHPRFVWLVDWLARKRGWPREKGEKQG